MSADILMQTSFSLAQLADPEIQEADAILRRCVHCGFCTPLARPIWNSATSSIRRAAAST
jgi:hypothetical protein